jgi:hypothetical protein
MHDARARVVDAVERSKGDDRRGPEEWEFECWVVNTERGDKVAREALAREP